MHQSQFFMLAAALGFAAAVPLNINLGAYSPALVVGDGEISLGAKEAVSQIMGALQGAAVSAGNGATTGAATTAGTTTAGATTGGTTKDVSTTAQITSLSSGAGMGNDLEPRIRARSEQKEATPITERDVRVHARDLSGFDRALNFATTALTTGPQVELGTENAGIGILIKAGVNNGGTAAANNEAKAAAAKRDVGQAETRSKVTTVFVREIVDDMPEADLNKRGTALDLDASNAKTLAMTFVEEA